MLPMASIVRTRGGVVGVPDQDRPDGPGQPADVRNFAEADEETEVADTAPQGDELGEAEVAAILASQADPDTPAPDAPVG